MTVATHRLRRCVRTVTRASTPWCFTVTVAMRRVRICVCTVTHSAAPNVSYVHAVRYICKYINQYACKYINQYGGGEVHTLTPEVTA